MRNINKKISRREAIGKTGKYAALTAVATFLILNPKQSQADSLPGSPAWSKVNQNQNKKTKTGKKGFSNNAEKA